MPPRAFTPALRMRFLYPPATRPISTTPHLFGGGSYPKKPPFYSKGPAKKMPSGSTILTATSFQPRQPRHKPRKVPKPGPAPAVIPKVMPMGPSRALIHYIPPSNPLRSKLGPGMYYNAKSAPNRCSSTPLDQDVETEYMYTLMLRKVFSIPVTAGGIVALKYAIKRCTDATGSHQRATATRLRKGFLSEAMGTQNTKKKAWVCNKARATLFEWDLHENMRYIRGHLFIGGEVDYYTPEGQVFGAQGLEKPNFEEERGRKFRQAIEILQRDSAAAAAASTTTSKIAGTAAASDFNSDGSDSNGKIRDDWVLEGSGSDTDFEALMIGDESGASSTRGEWMEEGSGEDSDEKLPDYRVFEDSGSDTDFDALMTANNQEEGEDDGEDWEDDDEDWEEGGAPR